jgi:broad specificity phosphatase PhoE
LREGLKGTRKTQRRGKKWTEQNFPAFEVDQVDELDRLGTIYNNPGREEPYEALWQRVRGVFAYIFENYADALLVLLMSHCHVEQTIQREITGWDAAKEEKKSFEFFVGEAGAYAIVVKGKRG